MYIKDFIRHPFATGSIVPSSPYLAQQYIDLAELSARTMVVELGPGNGCITKAILLQLSPSADYFSIEINPSLVKKYMQNCPTGLIYEDSMEHLPRYLQKHGFEYSDCIISGIPWTNFSAKKQRELTQCIYDCLAPGGVFLTMVYVQSPYVPTGKSYKALIDEMFSSVEQSPLVWKNFPPAYVYKCTK